MIDAPIPDSPVSPADTGGGSILGPVHLTRAIILATSILFAIVFYYMARWIHWPDEPGFRGSLGQAPVAIGAFLAVILLLGACTILGTWLAGRRWFMAGLMAATAGLTAWSVRGGNMTAVLFNANNTGANQTVFLQLLGELVVLYAVIGGLWNLIWTAAGGTTQSAVFVERAGPHSQAGRMKKAWLVGMFGVAGYIWWEQSERAASTPRREEGRSTGAALLAQTALFAVFLLIFAVTALKKQVLTSAFLSGVISTAIAEYFFADRKAGRWYWIAPLAVGAFGYLAGYFSPAGLETGDLQGMFAPLTRVLPLDYASMGCAGVLFGYWWMEPDVEPPLAVEAETADMPAVDGSE